MIKIAKGEWKAVKLPGHGWQIFAYVDEDNKNVAIWDLPLIAVDNQFPEFEEMEKANAEFIAEAGTVANETGKTPRQLADQNKELLATLSTLLNEAKEAAKFHNNDWRKDKNLLNAESLIERLC